MKIKSVLLAGAAGVLAFAVTAGANPDITPVFTGVTGGPVVFTFNYTMVIGSAEQVQPGPGTAPPASTPPGSGTAGASAFSDYITIFDFTGYNGTHLEPAGWALSVLPGNLGSTPGLTSPGDLAGVANLTWYRTGATLNGPQTIAGFSANTTVGSTITNGFYASDATKFAAGDPQNGFAVQTAGFTTVPTPPPPSGVPEPATLLLLGSGLAGLAGWRQWRTKKA